MDDLKQEFWGDLQADLYTVNSAIYLANQSLEDIIKQEGYKVHKPIVSHPQIGTYTKGSDIAFSGKTATKETLTVETFKYAAEEIDVTDKKQNPYDLISHSLTSIRKGLMNVVEQDFLTQISSANHHINSGTAVTVSAANILDIIEEAEGKLGSFDVSYETAMRALVLGPQTVAKLRRAKSDRETKLGDSVLENGVVGPWQGWTVVQNNNLPWSATLKIDAQPTEGDTVTISGVVFTFKATPVNPGDVDIAAAATARANLEAAVEGGAGAGTAYIELSARDKFILRRKRNVTATTAETMVFSGYGDIAVSETLTDATNVWASQQQKAIFMQRGAIDLVMQFMDLKIGDKEKGFADLPKGIIGLDSKMFSDGQDLAVELVQDASAFY